MNLSIPERQEKKKDAPGARPCLCNCAASLPYEASNIEFEPVSRERDADKPPANVYIVANENRRE